MPMNFQLIRTIQHTQATCKMAPGMDLELVNNRTEAYIKVTGLRIIKKDKVLLYIIVINLVIVGNLRKIKDMELAKSDTKMEVITKDNGSMIKYTERDR